PVREPPRLRELSDRLVRRPPCRRAAGHGARDPRDDELPAGPRRRRARAAPLRAHPPRPGPRLGRRRPPGRAPSPLDPPEPGPRMPEVTAERSPVDGGGGGEAGRRRVERDGTELSAGEVPRLPVPRDRGAARRAIGRPLRYGLAHLP